MSSIPTVRIVVAGDLGTGKSCLINFYLRALFADFDPTLEDTYCKQVLIGDTIHNLEIVDTVDNEFRNDNERISLYQNCDVILLTYSIDDIESFNHIYVRYSNLPINEEVDNKKISYSNGRIKCFPPIILVGTKSDLESARQVATQSAQKLADRLKLQGSLECSCVNNVNVDETFELAVQLGLNHQQSDNDLTHIYAGDEESQIKSSDKKHCSANSSVVSKQSALTNNNNESSKVSKTNDKFAAIQEDDSVIKVNNPPPNNYSNSREVKKSSQSTFISASNKPELKNSPSCCIIM
jgi:GTPase KRas protein